MVTLRLTRGIQNSNPAVTNGATFEPTTADGVRYGFRAGFEACFAAATILARCRSTTDEHR
jgi:hypothetical protein